MGWGVPQGLRGLRGEGRNKKRKGRGKYYTKKILFLYIIKVRINFKSPQN